MKMCPNKFYRLTQDVKNPNPDRRKKSVDAWTTWPTGTLVFLREHEYPSPKNDKDTYKLRRLEFVNQNYASLHALKEYVLIDAAVGDPVEENLNLLLFRLDHSGHYLLSRLVDAGKVTLKDIEEALQHEKPCS